MTQKFSEFTLERYRLGELDPEDTAAINDAIASDENLRLSMEQLEKSDEELRHRYPMEFFNLQDIPAPRLQRPRMRIVRAGVSRGASWTRMAGLAAVIIAGILIPVLYFIFSTNTNKPEISGGTAIASVDRTKGLIPSGCELSVYLKDANENILKDRAVLTEGNTVQLAYNVPAGDEYYGVIFSIDGRTVVTMHYPYRKGQSSLLAAGKRTFLNEAYTLDDAPDYEVFVMVVSEQPLIAETVIREAQALAENSGPADPRFIEEKSREAFSGCEVKTLTVLKR